MRDFQVWGEIIRTGFEAEDLSRDNVQTGGFAELFAFREKNLQSEAYAQKGFSRFNGFYDRCDQLERVKIFQVGHNCGLQITIQTYALFQLDTLNKKYINVLPLFPETNNPYLS